MEPAFQRGDILFLNNQDDPIRVGEIVVFKIKDRDIPIVHRVLEVHEKYVTPSGGWTEGWVAGRMVCSWMELGEGVPHIYPCRSIRDIKPTPVFSLPSQPAITTTDINPPKNTTKKTGRTGRSSS